VIVGGAFAMIGSNYVNFVARLNANGTHDLTFNGGEATSNHVFASAIQPDGKILIGGSFTSYAGIETGRLTRLNPNGTLDNTWTPGGGAEGEVYALALQPDGKLILGGAFATYNGILRGGVARIGICGTISPNTLSEDVSCFGESDGSIDSSPSGGSSPYIYSWNDGQSTQDRADLAAGNYILTVTDVNGCSAKDTIIVGEPALISSSFSEISCLSSYEWNGQIYTSNGSYQQVFSAVNGCDSVAMLNLTLNAFPDVAVTQSGLTLTADYDNGSYQWLDCGGMTAIIGAVSQSYDITSNGSFAVSVTSAQGCNDTSACFTFATLGNTELAAEISVFPNPASDVVELECVSTIKNVKILAADGRLVSSPQVTGTKIHVDLPIASGPYMIEAETGGKRYRFRIIKL
jgi:hypothetical protein